MLVTERGTNMKSLMVALAIVAAGLPTFAPRSADAQGATGGIDGIETVVVIYAENHSFDNLYGGFPGADGLQNVTGKNSAQVDRDGSVLEQLPPVWDGLTAKGVSP